MRFGMQQRPSGPKAQNLKTVKAKIKLLRTSIPSIELAQKA